VYGKMYKWFAFFSVGGTGLCFVFNLRMLIHLLFAKEDVRRCSREFGSRESEPPTPRFLNRLRVLSSFYFTFHVTVVSASTSVAFLVPGKGLILFPVLMCIMQFPCN